LIPLNKESKETKMEQRDRVIKDKDANHYNEQL
jgi:hypothetical protein